MTVVTTTNKPRPPVLERITQNVVDTLQRVTQSAGASVDLIVERPNPTVGQKIRHGLAVVVQGDPDMVIEDVSVQFTHWSQPYEVYVYAIQGAADETPVDARLNWMLADVMAALVVDRHRGGLAMETVINAPEFEVLDVNAVGGRVIAKFTVAYETYFNNPFRSRHEADE